MTSEIYAEIEALHKDIHEWRELVKTKDEDINQWRELAAFREKNLLDLDKIIEQQAEKIRSLMKECDRLVEQRSFLLSVIKGEIE